MRILQMIMTFGVAFILVFSSKQRISERALKCSDKKEELKLKPFLYFGTLNTFVGFLSPKEVLDFALTSKPNFVRVLRSFLNFINVKSLNFIPSELFFDLDKNQYSFFPEYKVLIFRNPKMPRHIHLLVTANRCTAFILKSQDVAGKEIKLFVNKKNFRCVHVGDTLSAFWESEADTFMDTGQFYKTNENLQVLEDKINEIVFCISCDEDKIINLFILNASSTKPRKNYCKKLFSSRHVTIQNVLDALKLNQSFVSYLIQQLEKL